LKPHYGKLVILLLTFLFSINTYGQTKTNAWEGAYGQIGFLGYESYMPQSSSGTTTIGNVVLPTTSSANNANGYTGNISIGYNFALDDKYVLGLGASLYPGKSTSASTTVSNAVGTVNGSYNVSTVFSIFLSPGYAIDENRMIYGKVGYTGATFNTSASGNVAGNFDQQSLYVNGVVFGLGYKQIITGSIYVFGEVNYAIDTARPASVVTNDGFVVNSTVKANGYDVILGVGYRF